MKAYEVGSVLGFQCSRFGPTITYLFFLRVIVYYFLKRQVHIVLRYVGVLDVYARASKQVINFAKSALCASASMGGEECERLAVILGVRVVDCHESYRYLLFTKSKECALDFGGVVAKMTEKCIGDLGVFFVRQKGLSFRDLATFNRAMLNKQCWRILKNPTSLTTKVLKRNYFLRTSFLQVESSDDNSFMWKSLVWGMRKIVGVGIVIRDLDGFVEAASSQRISATYSPHVAKAVAIYKGFLLASQTDFWRVEVESDAAVVVGWVNDGKVMESEVGLVVEDIKLLTNTMLFCTVNFVSRKFNRVAHCLTKLALSSNEDLYWLEEYPPFLTRFLVADCPICKVCFLNKVFISSKIKMTA
ncbi:hypothetical protein Dsin_011674 [Dipteronia sinensis]|uniref:RNase H type-1 domain-containing protein n=1 Tax=Dipteronia sinensis TaxID=43782 RepID=A0AAE0E7G8_9ROSI|nr:hypothetical protein Dsin_011674 [Dipteronia sinensis]